MFPRDDSFSRKSCKTAGRREERTASSEDFIGGSQIETEGVYRTVHLFPEGFMNGSKTRNLRHPPKCIANDSDIKMTLSSPRRTGVPRMVVRNVFHL